MDRKFRRSTWEIEDLNNIDQLDLTNIYRTSHPIIADYTLFSRMLGSFSRIDHIEATLSLNKFKKIEMHTKCLSEHNRMKLKISNRGKTGKSTCEN